MRVVPVAYITKFSGSIRILRDVRTSESNPKYLRLPEGRIAGPSEWTEDRAVAVGRYQKALRRRADSARKELSACETALALEPVFAEGWK